LCHHICIYKNMGQHCALLWPKMRSHRDVSVTRRGTAPMGLIYQYGRYNKCHLLWRHRRTAF
jgi:hypothetical protein